MFRQGVGLGWRTYGTRVQYGTRKDFLGLQHSPPAPLFNSCFFPPMSDYVKLSSGVSSPLCCHITWYINCGSQINTKYIWCDITNVLKRIAIELLMYRNIQGVQLKSGSYFNIGNLFTTCYITQLTWIYGRCWKLCPFISVHLSTRFTMFLLNLFRNRTFYWRLPSKFFNKTFSTMDVRHRFWITFQYKYTFFHC
jgi:hypothetical protein